MEEARQDSRGGTRAARRIGSVGAASGERRETQGCKGAASRIRTQYNALARFAQQGRKDPGAEDVLDREGDRDGQTKHVRRRKNTKNYGVSVQQIRY